MNICWNLVSYLRLKFVSCERICSKGKIRNSPLPHSLKCPSAFTCWFCGYRVCWRYTLTLSLNLVFPLPVSPIYSSLHVSQITTYIRLELSHVKRFFNLKVIFRLGDWRFLCISLILWKPLTLFFFKQLTENLIVL